MSGDPRPDGTLAREIGPFGATMRGRHETAVVPGRFFGAGEHFRLALGCAPEILEGGLGRLARALDETGLA